VPWVSWTPQTIYVLRRLHGEDDAVETVRDPREVIDARLPDERLVLDAARIKAEHPMAYADAFAAAPASAQDATLWTGDPESLSTERPGAGAICEAIQPEGRRYVLDGGLGRGSLDGARHSRTPR
jgi:predicted nucleic acid-binding protein